MEGNQSLDMPINKEERTKVEKIVWSCLKAAKQDISMVKLQSFFREVEGRNIPYKNLGYNSLIEMLRDGKDFCTLKYGPNGEILVQAKENMTFSHTQNYPMDEASSKAVQERVSSAFKGTTENTKPAYVEQLKEFCSTCDLVLKKFKTTLLANGSFVSAVTAGHERFWTYPRGYPSKEAAENAVSKLALQGLKNSCNKSAELTNSSVTQDPSSTLDSMVSPRHPEKSLDSEMADRIFELFKENVSALWSTKVEEDYNKKFNANLPPNWISELIRSPNAKLTVISPMVDKYIVLPDRTSTTECKQAQLPELKFPYWEVYVCHVSSVSNVFVRLKKYSALFEDLSLKMKSMDQFFKSANEAVIGNIYAVKMDNNWHRVKVLNKESCRASALLIDTGEEKIIPSSSLKKIDVEFLQLPAQAVKVKLANLSTVESSERNLQEVEYMLLEKTFHAKVLSLTGEDITVSLFESPDAESPVSWRPPLDSLGMTDEEVSLKSKSMKFENLMWNELESCQEISIPSLPPPETFFEVTVPFAISPSNFMVQSWRDLNKLEDLQNEMNLFYDNPSNWKEITFQDLNKDKFFALKYLIDDSWYRIKVICAVDDKSVKVRFVDYGDVTVADIKHIKRLDSTFRKLPMQAIKATLTDVIPMNGDWTAQDTAWFSKRVVEKQFVSYIKSISHDQEDGMIQIGVSLVDTTDPDIDVHIDKELVHIKRAVLA